LPGAACLGTFISSSFNGSSIGFQQRSRAGKTPAEAPEETAGVSTGRFSSGGSGVETALAIFPIPRLG